MLKKIVNLVLIFCLLSTSAIASSSYKSYSSSRSSYSSSRSSGYSGSSRSSSYSPSKSSSYSSTVKPSYSDTSYKSNSNTYKSGNSATNNNPDNSFMGKIERNIDNYEDRNSTFKSTTKLSAPVNKVSTAQVSNGSTLSSNKAYVTSGVAAGVVAGSLASDSKDTFTSTSTKSVNNDNSAIIKPSVNSPPLSNGISVNKTYVGLNNNTPVPTSTTTPLSVNKQYVEYSGQPTPYVVNNYNNNNNSVDSSGSLTNTLLNYALISSIMNHDKPKVVNNYQNSQNVSSASDIESKIRLQQDNNQQPKDSKENSSSSSGLGFLIILGLVAIVLLGFFAII